MLTFGDVDLAMGVGWCGEAEAGEGGFSEGWGTEGLSLGDLLIINDNPR